MPFLIRLAKIVIVPCVILEKSALSIADAMLSYFAMTCLLFGSLRQSEVRLVSKSESCDRFAIPSMLDIDV